jgi:copper chaperone NosL
MHRGGRGRREGTRGAYAQGQVSGLRHVRQEISDWAAQIVFKDGSYAVFDGAKDLFKCYHNLGKYYPSRRQSDIDSIYVTDYYSLQFIDAYKAEYVMGSNVYGPMGNELIPFAAAGDAKEFMNDHKGKVILKFKDVGPNILKGLD